jgi:hypothetical protein
MRLKGCYGQFQTRGIGRETYGGLFRQSGAFMGGAFAGMGSRAGRITIEGFVTRLSKLGFRFVKEKRPSIC